MVEGEQPPLEVHIGPAQREQFLLTPSGREGKDNDSIQGRVLTHLTCGEQSLAFLVAQKADSPS
jgi:hypothetical protein